MEHKAEALSVLAFCNLSNATGLRSSTGGTFLQARREQYKNSQLYFVFSAYSSASPSLLKPLHVLRSSPQTAAISSAALKAVLSHQGEYQTPQAGCNRNTSVNTSLLALSRYTLFSSLSLLTRLASAASPASLKFQMWRSSSASSLGAVFVSTPAAVWKKFLLKQSMHKC